MSIWTNSGGLIIDPRGGVIDCPECPCERQAVDCSKCDPDFVTHINYAFDTGVTGDGGTESHAQCLWSGVIVQSNTIAANWGVTFRNGCWYFSYQPIVLGGIVGYTLLNCDQCPILKTYTHCIYVDGDGNPTIGPETVTIS
jgi:hypothetical protein